MIKISASHADLSRTVVTQIAKYAAEVTAQWGCFTVAFSGGSLPALVCPPLITEFADQTDWSAWHVFFADERWVPRQHPDSNYRLLREQLLDHVPIPTNQVYVMDEGLAPAAAATEYIAKLAVVFGTAQPPSFDLVLLGMGPDGHTASLFPDHGLLAESERWVAPIGDAPKPPPCRITFTLPVLNGARKVFFIITGANKAETLAQIMTKPPSRTRPAGMVLPVDGNIEWFLDTDAAAALPTGLRHAGIEAAIERVNKR